MYPDVCGCWAAAYVSGEYMWFMYVDAASYDVAAGEVNRALWNVSGSCSANSRPHEFARKSLTIFLYRSGRDTGAGTGARSAWPWAQDGEAELTSERHPLAGFCEHRAGNGVLA